MRGYGRHHHQNIRVDTAHHNACDVGDEAIMLGRDFSVYVGYKRHISALYARKDGFEIAICDDGLQSLHFKSHLNIAVIDGHYGFGNEQLLPAGPLRISLKDGLKKIDAVILVNEDVQQCVFKIKKLKPDIAIFYATIDCNQKDLAILKNQKIIAFCGIARAKKFEKTLQQNHLNILDFKSYGDHYIYRRKDIEALRIKAKSLGAKLLTTEKDLSRLANSDLDVSDIFQLRIDARFLEGSTPALKHWINEQLR